MFGGLFFSVLGLLILWLFVLWLLILWLLVCSSCGVRGCCCVRRGCCGGGCCCGGSVRRCCGVRRGGSVVVLGCVRRPVVFVRHIGAVRLLFGVPVRDLGGVRVAGDLFVVVGQRRDGRHRGKGRRLERLVGHVGVRVVVGDFGLLVEVLNRRREGGRLGVF